MDLLTLSSKYCGRIIKDSLEKREENNIVNDVLDQRRNNNEAVRTSKVVGVVWG